MLALTFRGDDVAPEQDNPQQGQPVLPDLPAFPGREEDVLFKIQMSVANFFYGYWKHAIGLFLVILAVVFVYGTWQNHVRDSQRAIQADVAQVTTTLRAGLKQSSQDPAMLKAQSAEGARRLVAVADAARGPGAVYAYLRAAMAWHIAEQPDQELETWKKAAARNAGGELGWAAVSGYAAALFDKGDVDTAISTLSTWGMANTGYEAQRALFEVAHYQDLAGRKDQAITAYQDFQTRFPASPLVGQATSNLNRLRGQG